MATGHRYCRSRDHRRKKDRVHRDRAGGDGERVVDGERRKVSHRDIASILNGDGGA